MTAWRGVIRPLSHRGERDTSNISSNSQNKAISRLNGGGRGKEDAVVLEGAKENPPLLERRRAGALGGMKPQWYDSPRE